MPADSRRPRVNSDRPPPIFVVGFPRSGTTLLQALLGSHPAIAAPPEMHYILRVVELQDFWGDLDDDDVVRRVVAETLDLPRGILDPADFDVSRITRQVLAGPRSYPAVLDAVMTNFADRHGKTRWSEKTPLQSPEQIWSLFPRAQVVHLVRDPREVVRSVRQSPLLPGKDTWTLVHYWQVFNAAAVEQGVEAGEQSYLRVRYEDLCEWPERTLDSVFGFLGEPAVGGDAIRNLAARPTSVSPAAWWTHDALREIRPAAAEPGRDLPFVTRAIVSTRAEPLGTQLGYRPATTTERVVAAVAAPVARLRQRLAPRSEPPPPSDPAERYRYQKTLVEQRLTAAGRRRPGAQEADVAE